jgi:membrane fusion protein, copper/silver efflux system
MSSFWEKHRQKLVPASVVFALLVLGLVFRKPIIAWFDWKDAHAPSQPAGSAHVHGQAAPPPAKGPPKDVPLPAHQLEPAALAAVETAFSAYEEIRVALAKDSVDGIPPAALRLEQALHAAASGLKDVPKISETMHTGAEAAKQLSTETNLDKARHAFGEVSKSLVLLAGADPRLAKGRHVFECPMTDTYARWIQESDKMANPYMGPKMLMCGSEESFPTAGEGGEIMEDHAAHIPGGDQIVHYTCPMHPSVKQGVPGQCPICGMDLVPVTKAEVETGVIMVDQERRQLIGVKTGLVEKRKLEKAIRTVGRITYDETRIVDVTLKFQGFIGKLYADAKGKRVKKGSTLFTVYSPEVYQAQQDLLIARGGSDALSSGPLFESAKRRLQLWDVSSGTIRRVLEKNQPIRYVPIASPAGGYIVEKDVFAGSAVEPGMRLLRIANLDKVWIDADLYEAELPLVKVGQPATVSLAYLPESTFTGKVTFIYPYLSSETRTGRVRIELDTKQVELKPDMYATIELAIERGERLVVAESAVIYAGKRRIVFLDLGGGKLRAQEIEVGIKTGDYYEVTKGLRAGQRIVTSGNFLIAAESRLKSATGQW